MLYSSQHIFFFLLFFLQIKVSPSSYIEPRAISQMFKLKKFKAFPFSTWKVRTFGQRGDFEFWISSSYLNFVVLSLLWIWTFTVGFETSTSAFFFSRDALSTRKNSIQKIDNYSIEMERRLVISLGIRKSGCLEIRICADWDSLATLLQKQIQGKTTVSLSMQ